MDVALASCRELPEPDPDAAPLTAALTAAGVQARVLAWDDPDVDWSGAALTVLRSTWNYPQHRDAFLDWTTRTAEVSRLWNPLDVVRWNTHKGYLLELERRGVPITPTTLVPAASTKSLGAVMDERGWDDVVVKPAVSASSFKTRRVGRDTLEAGEAHLRELLPDRDVLVQRYLRSVEDYGERALVWIDGELTHSVRKTVRFDGEDESVSPEAMPITDAEADLACRVVAEAPGEMLYARIDVAPGPDGDPVLMEFELVEPSLFFSQCPAALDRFISGIRQRLR